MAYIHTQVLANQEDKVRNSLKRDSGTPFEIPPRHLLFRKMPTDFYSNAKFADTQETVLYLVCYCGHTDERFALETI